MNYAVIVMAFLLSGVVASMSGLAVAFMCVYIPVQLLFSSLQEIPIAFWPHISAPHAAIYGTVMGALVSGKKLPRIKLCLLDFIMVAVLLSMATSAGVNEDLHAFANVADNQIMEWLAPYFLARLAFTSESARAAGVRILAGLLMVFGILGFMETRLSPYFVSQQLRAFQLWQGLNSMVYHRFGFMRAMLTFQHPIDLGNVALMLVGIIPMLALTSEVGMKKWYVRAAWIASLFLLLIAISFTAYFGLVALVGMYLLLKYVKGFRRWLAVLAVLGIAAVSVYTAIVLSEKTPERPTSNDIFAGSLWMRQVIVHRGWAMAKNAGWFGFSQSIDYDQLQLNSVDNAYILMVLIRGWLTLGIFLLIPVVLGARLSRALVRTNNEMEARPLMIAAATVAAVMIAMYTVWFGFVYANIFVVLLGFSATLAEFFLGPRTVTDELHPDREDDTFLPDST